MNWAIDGILRLIFSCIFLKHQIVFQILYVYDRLKHLKSEHISLDLISDYCKKSIFSGAYTYLWQLKNIHKNESQKPEYQIKKQLLEKKSFFTKLKAVLLRKKNSNYSKFNNKSVFFLIICWSLKNHVISQLSIFQKKIKQNKKQGF